MKAFIFLPRVGAILIAALLASCASVPATRTGDAAPLFRDALFKAPTEPVDPGFANAANTLGVIYLKRNHLAPAEHALRYTLQRDPDDVSVLSKRLN